MMLTDDYLAQGIAALKAGNKQEARRLLDAAIRAAPDDERTWGWFYNVAANDEERLRCVKEVLRINPNNEKAKQIYDKLNGLNYYPQNAISGNQPSENKSNSTLTVFGAIIIAVILGGLLWFFLSSIQVASPLQVTYKITGSASQVFLTYQNGQGGTEQTEAVIPWQYTVTVNRGAFLYISAQNQGEGGSVTCEIWVDGVKWRNSTSGGAYVISTYSGSAGGY
jgi:tetratricopeptide (TPR) repeat protein